MQTTRRIAAAEIRDMVNCASLLAGTCGNQSDSTKRLKKLSREKTSRSGVDEMKQMKWRPALTRAVGIHVDAGIQNSGRLNC